MVAPLKADIPKETEKQKKERMEWWTKARFGMFIHWGLYAIPARHEWVKMDGERVPWETCQTFSGSWGYHRDETTWKSTRQLLVLLIETISKGWNLLLNTGPTARGIFDERAMDRLIIKTKKKGI